MPDEREPEPEAVRSPDPLVLVLATLRFAVEIGLMTSFVVIGVSVIDGATGWLLGCVLAIAAAAIWAAFVAPRRPIDLPLGARLAIELAVFLVAGAGLALVGLGGWAVVLIGLELIIVAALFMRGVAPGTDVTMR